MKPPPTHTHPAHSTYCSPLHRRMTPSPYSSSSSSSLHSHSAPPPDCCCQLQPHSTLKPQNPNSSQLSRPPIRETVFSSSKLTLSNLHKTGPLIHSLHTTYTQTNLPYHTPTHTILPKLQPNPKPKKRKILKKKKIEIPLGHEKTCKKMQIASLWLEEDEENAPLRGGGERR